MSDDIGSLAAGLPPFPTWPPPSGGAPVTTPELGPIKSPFPYGSPQPANISTANPAPPQLATFFPRVMPPLNGQNQKQQLPVWPWPAKNVNLPTKADPLWSKIP
jgi:hypothetical protein